MIAGFLAAFGLGCSRGGNEEAAATPASSAVALPAASAVSPPTRAAAPPTMTPAATATESSPPSPTPYEKQREERKQALRRLVDGAAGFAHLTRGMNEDTIRALQDACKVADQPLLRELVLDQDRIVAMTAAEVLVRFGETGLDALQSIADGLPPDAPQLVGIVSPRLEEARRNAPDASLAGDPFERPPRPAVPNCGPDTRQHFAASLSSRQDFAKFLRERGRWLAPSVQLDNFRDEKGAVDWERVGASATLSRLGKRTVYALRFAPGGCGSYDVRVTSDGFTSLYGCCGK